MKKPLVVLLIGLALPCLAFAQAQPRKPGPEVQKLGYFVGTWKFEAAPKTGTPGTYSGTLDCQWFKGGFFLVCHEQSPSTGTEDTSVWSYNPEAKVYAIYRYWSDGTLEQAKGSIQNQTWTFNISVQGGDKTVKTRLTMVQESPTAFAVTWQDSTKGGPWTTTETVKVTKVK